MSLHAQPTFADYNYLIFICVKLEVSIFLIYEQAIIDIVVIHYDFVLISSFQSIPIATKGESKPHIHACSFSG